MDIIRYLAEKTAQLYRKKVLVKPQRKGEYERGKMLLYERRSTNRQGPWERGRKLKTGPRRVPDESIAAPAARETGGVQQS